MISNYSDYFYRYRSALIQTENGFKYSLNDHRRMIEGMKRNNPRLVERLVRRHLERGMEIILKEIDEGKMNP
jgi:DNA-binding GntR family transcriptional regulator